MKIKNVQIAALLCLAVIALASAPVFAFAGNGFSITFPSGWEINKEMQGVDAVAMSPAEGAGDTFRENIIIMQEELPGGMAIKEYVDISIDNIKKTLKVFNLISRKRISIGGQPADMLVYEHTYEGTKIKVGQAIVINKGKAFVITLSALPATYGTYAPKLEAALRTMKFK